MTVSLPSSPIFIPEDNSPVSLVYVPIPAGIDDSMAHVLRDGEVLCPRLVEMARERAAQEKAAREQAARALADCS